ncbi:hypothetical protein EAO30_20315 [Klebsiella pneumoniae]|nr:hypothetical protein EAO30_20315 [Klebsiella pneumoniae]
MFAVVPCQWRRIIGSNSEVTREMQKSFQPSLFSTMRRGMSQNRRFAVLTDETGRPWHTVRVEERKERHLCL